MRQSDFSFVRVSFGVINTVVAEFKALNLSVQIDFNIRGQIFANGDSRPCIDHTFSLSSTRACDILLFFFKQKLFIK